MSQPAEEPDLSADDELALDAIWQQIQQTEDYPPEPPAAPAG